MTDMTPAELARRYPRLYHMAELGSWPSIQKHGLLSTTALLDLFEVDDEKRHSIESEWRSDSVPIPHPIHGDAVIRDQGPMPPNELVNCLVNLTTTEWYELLNRMTFFWAEWRRLANLLNAVAYRNKPHCVITIETRALLARHGSRASLSAINSGFVNYGGPRGRDTFKSIANFPSGHTVWELAVDYSVPDLADLVISVEEWRRDTRLRVIWDRVGGG